MKVFSYHTKMRLRKVLQVLGILVLTGLVIWICWLVWLQRYVVYTREAETADMFIERVTHEIGKGRRVRVATSDGMEQVIILGQGGQRMSARELLEDVIEVSHQIRETARQKSSSEKNYLFDHLDEETATRMERIRLGEEEV